MDNEQADKTPAWRTDAQVWALCAVLAATAVALLVTLEPIAVTDGRPHLPWWLLAAAFAATEVGVVHIHIRRSSHSLTLGELPLVLGLLFAAPVEVMIGWMVGAGAVLVAQRELPPVRIAFNVALFGVTAGMAGAVFHVLAGHSPLGPGPAEWAAATAGAGASAVSAAALVAAAMALSGDVPAGERLRSMLATALGVAICNAALGLAVATVVEADARATVLLLAPAGALFIAYRAYTAERNRITSLEFLYAAGRALTSASEATAGLAGMLAMARETFRAELALVWTFASPDAPGARVAVGADGRVQIGDALDPEVADELRAMLDERPAQHVAAVDVGGALGSTLRNAGLGSAMLAALPGERGLVGAMVIADRVGVGGDFTIEELRLFESLADHAGAALGQDRLGRKVAELREIQQELEHQAFHDPLTGLANRLLFMNRIAYALDRRTGNAALLYIDLDDFKPVNDTLGHEAGDGLLRAVAQRLRNSLRTADTAARLGGDEFAVLLVDIQEEHARIVADRIMRALSEPYTLVGKTARISASMGLAFADSGAMGAEDLVRNADAAMYVSKHGGKRGLTVHDRGSESPTTAQTMS
jgi:diguanylate cyclase (GGDEF)-like protein